MQTVFEYITKEETAYQTTKVPVVEGYEWSMFEHVKLTTLYLNSKYKEGNQDLLPFRNIILPKINLEHRAVEFDLKEIEFFINSPENYKAFLIRKWHERWGRQNNISKFLDQLTETYTDYGGVLIEDTPAAMAVVPFQRLAFCDQTDMLSGPICQKHQYSPDQLKEMEKRGWKNIDLVIALAQDEKANSQNSQGGSEGKKVKTPGRYIDVYDLEGVLPDSFLETEGSEDSFSRQLQVVTFYTDTTGKKQGITLFSGKKTKERYKAFKRDEIYGRALGRGGVEELFEPQVWVNYTEIQKKELLDQVSKIFNWTDDPSFKGKNDTNNLENGSTLVVSKGSTFGQVNQSALNVSAFENAVLAWDASAREIASAQATIAGDETKSGMPFRLGALLNQESHSLHQYRKVQLGNFLSSEVYPDWVIPKMMKEVASGTEFLSSLSLDEMGQIVDQIASCRASKKLVEKVMNGTIIEPGQQAAMVDFEKQQFFKNNRHLITILKDELKDLPIEMETNITGEQRDKIGRTEAFSRIFTQVSTILMANPNFFTEHPEMAKLFNEVIESSGLSALNFGMNGYLPPKPPQLTPAPNAQKVPAQVQGQPQAA